MQRRPDPWKIKCSVTSVRKQPTALAVLLTGVCGKNPQVAAAQDLLVYVTKGYCEVTTRLRKEGTNISDAENRMVVMNLFMTITNANFDKEAIENRIHDTLHVKKELLKKVKDTSGLSEAALWDGSGDWEVIAGKVGSSFQSR